MKTRDLEKENEMYRTAFHILASIVLLTIVFLSIGYMINKANDNVYEDGFNEGVTNASIDFIDNVNFILQQQGYIYWTLPNNQTIMLVPYLGGEE